MPTIGGPINPQLGAAVFVKFMQGADYVQALKNAGKRFTTPTTVLGILDTGASATCLDRQIISNLALLNRGPRPIHTPSTGNSIVYRDTYDALVVIGESEPDPLFDTLQIIQSDF